MLVGRSAAAAVFAASLLSSAARAQPRLELHSAVPPGSGADIEAAEMRPAGGHWKAVAWKDLDAAPLEPGPYELRAVATAPPAEGVWGIELPVCAGLTEARVDGQAWNGPPPFVVPLKAGVHEVRLALRVSPYERRIACGEDLRVGPVAKTTEGLGTLAFASPHRGGGRAVVYVPPGVALASARALLVGLHPWNGSVWTYAAYRGLLDEARARGVVLLMPSGLGNSLYTADAEDEVLRALDALEAVAGAPPRSVSLWGASMGGAGATTIGFHHPDRFATVTSFFGDSKYDLGTYVRAILPDARAAHLVDALDVVDNARNLPVWLIHGDADATSSVHQSDLLAQALKERGFAVRYDRVPGAGHSGALVARFLPELVDTAATALPITHPDRVTYRSVRADLLGAYGVHLERASPDGDAFVDAQRSGDGFHVLRSEGVRAVTFDAGAP